MERQRQVGRLISMSPKLAANQRAVFAGRAPPGRFPANDLPPLRGPDFSGDVMRLLRLFIRLPSTEYSNTSK